MKTTLCTLYNSLYLDKGLVLYDSLKECAKDFELYVLCMDEKCYEVISDIGEDRLKPIHLADVENEKMLEAKSNRPIAEYCWTCTSRLIQYILETYKPECCTYIDADMYFYHDPQILVDEMINAGKSVMMVPHRFTERNKSMAAKVGTYCVEFNCFKNDAAGLEVLNHWHNQCLECCSNLGDGIHWGDQKYMDEWPVMFSRQVHVCENKGAGVAPWNIALYKKFVFSKKDEVIIGRETSNEIPLVFYHFQSVKYITRYKINTNIVTSHGIDLDLVYHLYYSYLIKIEKKKCILESKYNINYLIREHPAAHKRPIWEKAVDKLKPRSIITTAMSYVFNNHPYIIEIAPNE